MKFLILNDKKDLGSEVDLSQYKLNTFDTLQPKNLVCETLVEVDLEKKSVSFGGNVNVEMVRETDIELSLYDYVYIVEEKNGIGIIKNLIDNESYLDLVFNLLAIDDIDWGYSKFYLLSKVLESKPVKKENLSCILADIKSFVEKSIFADSGYIDLIKVLENIIPEDFEDKKFYMRSFYDFLEFNCELMHSLTDEERLFLYKNSKKYSLDISLKIEKIIENDMDVENLPF